MAYYGFPYRPVRKWSTKLVVYWKTSTCQEKTCGTAPLRYIWAEPAHTKMLLYPSVWMVYAACLKAFAECVCVKGRWVKGGLFVCVPRVRAGTQSKQASLHPPWGRVRRHTAQSNHRLNLTVTSVAKVCYEHKAHVQAHVCAHIHKSIFLQWHPKPKLSKHCHLTDEPCSVSESLPCSLFLFFSLPLLHSLSHFPPPSKFNLTHEKDAGKMASLGRPLALIRHTHPFTKGKQSSEFICCSPPSPNDWSVFEAQPKVSHYRRYMAQQQLGLRDICKSTRI